MCSTYIVPIGKPECSQVFYFSGRGRKKRAIRTSSIKFRATAFHAFSYLSLSTNLQVSSVELMDGDTIVMGSDGLFDNIFDHEIVSMISRYNDVFEAGMRIFIQLILTVTQLHNLL